MTTTTEHLDQVCAILGAAPNPRTTEILQAAARHLHAFVEEVQLSREEWRAGIDFLTAVGQRCDEVRQEFILLSDTLGVSMLLEMINAQPAPGASEPTVLGPFYLPDVPELSMGDSIVSSPETGGQPLTVSGTISDLSGQPVDGAVVDIWQVQPNGRYDIEESPGKRNLRGRFRTGQDGTYRFRTVRPVDYTIPDDGPVGSLLRASGRDSWRPAHVHVMVRAEGFKPLVTHVFDEGSPHLGHDAVFGVRPSLVAPLGAPECVFDLVLEAEPARA